MAEVVETAPAQAATTTATPEPNSPLTGRPSIAILPFRPLAMPPELAILADAIPYEIIQALSRLRWLAVIARGSSFRFRKPDPDLKLVASALGARYVLSGIIEANVSRLAITLELSDASTNEVIWGNRIGAPLDAIDDLRSRIVAHLITALDVYIPLNEAQSAQMATIETLDAWASYHLGLQHLYRFITTDNQRAKGLFERKPKSDTKDIDIQAAEKFISGAVTSPSAKAKKKPVALRFDADLLAAIDAMAARRGTSRNAIISYWCSKGVESE